MKINRGEQTAGDFRVHYPEVDSLGHSKGWGSKEQFVKIEETDGELAQLFASLERAGIRQSTVVILSADHGGAGLTLWSR
ncbi:MAG: alkaline phosphatase family protein [Nibricoccus sp.]